MRLIDADLLSKEINSLQVTITGLRAGKGVITECMNRYGDSVLRTIEEQPTAYDTDKVVFELEKELSLADKENERCTGESHLQLDSAKGYASGISSAIEIVKSGSVEIDNVCEWKAIGANDNWSTSCDKNSTHYAFGVAWFNRCPYCGRKIKVVE